MATGTFGPMCSSGAFINTSHANPRIKIQKAWMNDVPAYAGLAAVDLYIGATEMSEHDPLNRNHPGEFRYGGGHVIQELIAGQDVRLRAVAYGTDCYPARTWIPGSTLRTSMSASCAIPATPIRTIMSR